MYLLSIPVFASIMFTTRPWFRNKWWNNFLSLGCPHYHLFVFVQWSTYWILWIDCKGSDTCVLDVQQTVCFNDMRFSVPQNTPPIFSYVRRRCYAAHAFSLNFHKCLISMCIGQRQRPRRHLITILYFAAYSYYLVFFLNSFALSLYSISLLALFVIEWSWPWFIS